MIADLVLRPKFDSDDVKKEHQVVLEEIKMDLDNPEYLLHEIFTRGFWPEHPLGRPILGTPETVRQFSRDVLRTDSVDWFAPDHLVRHRCGQREARAGAGVGQGANSGSLQRACEQPGRAMRPRRQPHAPIHLEKKRELEQVHRVPGRAVCAAGARRGASASR